MGGRNPVRIQSMCNTPTSDVEASARQCIRLFEAGASLVRLSVRNRKEAEALGAIREKLSKKGIDLPLAADVHFSPTTALQAATVVQKVRINPGNFAGNEIRRELVPLLDVCRQHRTCLRIGVNHGSLSERILNDHGDSPEGMVASALEYLEVCEEEGFRDVVVSLKSSSTYLMIRANRMLVAELTRMGLNPPIHLGVTEAGDATEGRIKSAIGIGTLLAEGIGDTIRVSLTEDPEKEIPAARMIIEAAQRHYNRSGPEDQVSWSEQQISETPDRSGSVRKSSTPPGRHSDQNPPTPRPVLNIGGNKVPVVISSADPGKDYRSVVQSGPIQTETRPDYIFFREFDPEAAIFRDIPLILPQAEWKRNFASLQDANLHDKSLHDASMNNTSPHINSPDKHNRSETYPLSVAVDYGNQTDRSPKLNFLLAGTSELSRNYMHDALRKAVQNRDIVIVMELENNFPLSRLRKHLAGLTEAGISMPVILKLSSGDPDLERFIIQAAIDAGGLLSDRLCHGLWIENSRIEESARRRLCFDILQACDRRISKARYIACPSCGRTRFDITSVLAGIKKETAHLKNLKIAVMGCIVNGPGEMADADYGYVGSGKDRVTLFRGKEAVRKHIPQKNAVAELIALIKNDGRWTETDQ